MGQLLRVLKKHGIVDLEFNAKLDTALKRRNFLAHSFFVEHSHNFVSFVGRKQMIEELENDIELFNDVEAFLNPITMKFAEKYGLSKEKLNKIYEEMLMEAQSKDLQN